MKFLRDMFGLNSEPTPAQLGKKLMRELNNDNTYNTVDVPKCIALVEQGADLGIIKNDKSAIECALGHNIKLLQAMLARKPNLDWQDQHRHKTALHHAIYWKKRDHVVLLIEAGANLDILDKDAVTAREMLTGANNKNAADWKNYLQEVEEKRTQAENPAPPTLTEPACIPEMKKQPFQPGTPGGTP